MGAAEIKALRERTGAGMLDCKKALDENDGDVEKAIDWLRAKGIARAAKKAGRAATEGSRTVFTFRATVEDPGEFRPERLGVVIAAAQPPKGSKAAMTAYRVVHRPPEKE